jgi:predicted nucleic acid-binding protein
MSVSRMGLSEIVYFIFTKGRQPHPAADIILLDEKASRCSAVARGPRVTGILGVLGESATRGLAELAPAIDRLRMTDFRASPVALKAALDRFKAWQ